MFPSTYFYARFGISKMLVGNAKMCILHNLVGCTFYPIRINVLRWKHIYRRNSSMCIKRVMWLCTMGRDNLTNQQTDLVAQHLKCLVVLRCLSKVCPQSISVELSYTTEFSNSRHPPPKAMIAFIVFRLHALRRVTRHIWKWLYLVASPTFDI